MKQFLVFAMLAVSTSFFGCAESAPRYKSFDDIQSYHAQRGWQCVNPEDAPVAITLRSLGRDHHVNAGQPIRIDSSHEASVDSLDYPGEPGVEYLVTQHVDEQGRLYILGFRRPVNG